MRINQRPFWNKVYGKQLFVVSFRGKKSGLGCSASVDANVN